MEQWTGLFERAGTVEGRLAVIRGMELEGGTAVLRFLLRVAGDSEEDPRVRGEAIQVLITRPNLHGDREWEIRRELGRLVAELAFGATSMGALQAQALQYVVAFGDLPEVRSLATAARGRLGVERAVERVAAYLLDGPRS